MKMNKIKLYCVWNVYSYERKEYSKLREYARTNIPAKQEQESFSNNFCSPANAMLGRIQNSSKCATYEKYLFELRTYGMKKEKKQKKKKKQKICIGNDE